MGRAQLTERVFTTEIIEKFRNSENWRPWDYSENRLREKHAVNFVQKVPLHIVPVVYCERADRVAGPIAETVLRGECQTCENWK
jgi:hypothetical protein